MNQELANRNDAIAERSTRKNPFDVLPTDWIPVVSGFCEAKAHLLKSAGPVCYHLKLWMADGLTLDDAKALFRHLCKPSVMAGHNFDNQLLADMGSTVDAILRKRRSQEEDRRREEAERNPDSVDAKIISLADGLAMLGRRAQA